SAVIFEVWAHPLAKEHRVMALEDPLSGAMPQGLEALVGFQLVQCRVIRQFQQDDVVEIPAVGDVVPAEEPDPVLVAVLTHLPGEQRLHVELEERITAAAHPEGGREHGHRAPASSGPVELAGVAAGAGWAPAAAIVARALRRTGCRRWGRLTRPRSRRRSSSRCRAA